MTGRGRVSRAMGILRGKRGEEVVLERVRKKGVSLPSDEQERKEI